MTDIKLDGASWYRPSRMTYWACTGNCNQGRACACLHMRDSADKSAYQPTHSARENWLAVAVCLLLVIVTAVKWP